MSCFRSLGHVTHSLHHHVSLESKPTGLHRLPACHWKLLLKFLNKKKPVSSVFLLFFVQSPLFLLVTVSLKEHPSPLGHHFCIFARDARNRRQETTRTLWFLLAYLDNRLSFFCGESLITLSASLGLKRPLSFCETNRKRRLFSLSH